mgnify:CR=1 FL=1
MCYSRRPEQQGKYCSKEPKEEIRKEVQAVLEDFGTKGIMIGADCTIQGEGIRLDYIREAVEAAHTYRKGDE